MHDVEMRMATRAPQQGIAAGRAQAAVQHRTGERLTAASAPVVVGEQLVTNPAGQHGGARHGEPADFSRSQIGDVGHRMPHVPLAADARGSSGCQPE